MLPLFQPFQSIVSISPPSALSYCLCYFMWSSCHFGHRCWTWMCTPRAPRRGVGFQLSGPKGGFPFQNLWLINMSPGWKLIPWKTGGMFSNPATAVCAIHFFPHTHTLEGKECQSPCQQRYCLSWGLLRVKQPQSSFFSSPDICCEMFSN